ncbi:L-amino acid N-acyltransferase YncA [Pseudoduganella lurida]|uniref:L-amino acid N-acyltransferase YncA n=1 Tax=Pseudoduganella lurida TaxID=1036180 RepID=A0A562RM50_9BURK|nr:GNAT family N-acetyltransferase [Pseudoduganella lurida]TWI70115.1 L-amino acid N-acyltransferase YncA [Pseudoduganella lurida]
MALEPVRIRPATRADAANIGQIHVLGWQVGYRGIIPADFLAGIDVAKRQAYWDGVIAAGELNVIVAERGGQVIGWAAFGPDRDAAADRVLELQAIYVHPDAWRTGAGTSLIAAATAHAVGHAYVAMSLWVLAENRAGMQFYRGLDFVEHARKSTARGGRELVELQLLRALPGAAD